MTYRALFPFMCVLWLAVDAFGQGRFSIAPFTNFGLSTPIRKANPNNNLPDNLDYSLFINPAGWDMSAGYSFQTGCNVQYKLTRTLTICSSLGFQRYNHVKETTDKILLDPRRGPLLTKDTEKLNVTEGDAHGMVQLGLQIKIFSLKRLHVWGQVVANSEFYYRSYTIRRYYEPDQIVKDREAFINPDLKSFNISLAPSIGCDIDLSKRLALTTSFGAQQQLRSKYVSDYVITERWQSVWMSIGMRYHLGQGSGEERK
jgi:hypothetical protein